MGLFKKKKPQVIFFIYARGVNKRFSVRGLVSGYSEEELPALFHNWIKEQVDEFSKKDEGVVPINVNIIR